MSLPESWIDKVFEKLIVAYGHDFLSRWQGIDIGLVKADWAAELGGYLKNPAAIAYALDNLPADRPPNAKQFRALCNGRPDPLWQALPAPVDKPSEAVVAKVAELVNKAPDQGHKDWAHRLRQREKDSLGRGMTRAQREMWRTALGEPSGAAA